MMEKSKKENKLAIGIALGTAIGTAIGVATNNLGLWIGVGVAIGAGIGTSLMQTNNKKKRMINRLLRLAKTNMILILIRLKPLL